MAQRTVKRVFEVRRMIDTISATALIVGFVAAPFVLAMMWRNDLDLTNDRDASTVVAGTLGSETVEAFPLRVLIVFPWAVLAMVLVARLLRPGLPKRRSWLPFAVESAGRQVVDQSVFGSGAFTVWTENNPDVSVSNLVRPAAEERVRAFVAQSSDHATGSADRARSRSTAVEAPADGLVDRWTGPVEDHVVARGDTWWGLSETVFGDGSQWQRIRDLNVGREVAPGAVLRTEDELVRGWRVALPVTSDRDEQERVVR